MIKALLRLAYTGVVAFFSLTSYSQLQLTANTNAQALAQRLVGDGITISNVTLTSNSLSAGFFKNLGGTQLGLDSGIVLSTGRILTSGTSYGLNGSASSLASNDLAGAGDPQLQALLGTSNATGDAAILEFDLVPLGDTVRFRYVFSSDEYPTFTCSEFNDVFAFFISGPGIVGTRNIALVPGTNIPVAINSINDGTDFDFDGLCSGMGPGSPFTQYFVNNSGNTNFTHNGHTTVLTARAVVQPCQTYHLKIAIADVFDKIYDSGVFLEAKSLSSTPLTIINGNPVSSGVPYIIEGCTAGSIKISRGRRLPIPQPINLFFSGTATNGTDVQLIPSTVTIPANDSIILIPINPIADNVIEGTESFKIRISYGACGAVTSVIADSIMIDIRDQFTATSVVNAATCAANGSVTVSVPAGSGFGPYQYAINGGTFQASNTLNNLATGTYLVTVTESGGCVHNFPVTVGLTNDLPLVVLPSDTAVCVGARFTPRVITNTAGNPSYAWSPSFGLSSSTQAQPQITAQNNAQYILTATLGPCVRKDTLNLTVFPGPQVSAGPDLTIISGDQIQLQATAPNPQGNTYLYTPATSLSSATVLNPLASPTQTTTYTLTATTAQGCVSTDQVVVTVLNCVEPMNAFTPNGDGVNDFWLVNRSGCFRTATVEVFNRYGHRVYRSDNYSNNWNGTFEGKPVPDGTYYYIVRYQLVNGQPREYKGNVTILR